MSARATKVLVVDDDEVMLDVVGAALQTLGVSSYACALSAEQALGILEHDTIDMVLCDLNMPGMDGVEFLRFLAARRFAGAIVLMSGEDKRILRTAENLAKAHGLDVWGAVEKPITARSLAPLLDLADHVRGPRSARLSEQPTITGDELRQALMRDEIGVHFQPKIVVATGEVKGVETLARWRHAVRGDIPPTMFVAAAEREGLIDRLTRVVFNKAFSAAGRWRLRGFDLTVAVNVSTETVDHLDLPEFVEKTARECGLEPSRVMVEITETQLMRNLTHSLDTLTRLRLRRIGLSIDDFGTGYSSLEQLQRVPFVELKIDRAFVDGASHDTSARAILESSIELAKKLGMTTVAEGVETREDFQLLADLGCDLVQGFFVAHAMPAQELLPWVEHWEHAPRIN